jgi:hypothetical protein
LLTEEVMPSYDIWSVNARAKLAVLSDQSQNQRDARLLGGSLFWKTIATR